MCVFGPRHRSPSVQYAVLEDARAQARRRDCRNVRAADHRLGRIRGRAGAAQDAQPGAHCSAYHQRPDTAHRHLLLRRLRHGDDVADREGRTLPILHLLDQGPPGRDRLPRRQERAERRTTHIAELRKRASETDAKLKRLYDAIENGIADLSDPMLRDRVGELKAIRDQARVDAERAQDAIERVGPSITPQTLKAFAMQARKRMRTESGGYRRDHLRALAQRVEVDGKEVRIMGSKSELLRTLVAASSAKTAGFGVPSFVPKWRARRDSNS